METESFVTEQTEDLDGEWEESWRIWLEQYLVPQDNWYMGEEGMDPATPETYLR